MKLSIVTTLYKSSPYVSEFCKRASDAARGFAGDDFEIILVNDGSPDNSLAVAIQTANLDPHITVLDLSRNFGHHKAMMTGLAAARGDFVFLIDSDLEEQPEWLNEFSEHLQVHQLDVVFGVQQIRRGGFVERASGIIFYRLFRFFTGISQPDNIVTARLMSRRYVQALVRHRERELNIGGLWVITGFRQGSFAINKLSTSPTTYTFKSKFNHLINAVTSFSSLPLVFTFYSGLMISVTAVAYILLLFSRYFFVSAPPDGYTSIIASIWLFSGLIIFFLGIQGIYISKLFVEVKQRPYTIVRETFNKTTGFQSHD